MKSSSSVFRDDSESARSVLFPQSSTTRKRRLSQVDEHLIVNFPPFLYIIVYRRNGVEASRMTLIKSWPCGTEPPVYQYPRLLILTC